MQAVHVDFDPPADLRDRLERRDVEYLAVNDERLVVLFNREVVQLTVTTGTRGRVSTVEACILDSPTRPDRDWSGFLERLVDVLDGQLIKDASTETE